MNIPHHLNILFRFIAHLSHHWNEHYGKTTGVYFITKKVKS